MGGRTLISTDGAVPVSTTDAKAWARIDESDSDSIVAALVLAAVAHVEQFTGRRVRQETWDYYFDAFPAGPALEIPLVPCSAIGSINYTPEGGSETAFASSNYIVDTASGHARAVLKSSATWPADILQAANGVRVRLTAGYADGEVPEAMLNAIRLCVAHWFSHRGDAVQAEARALPAAVRDLLWPLALF